MKILFFAFVILPICLPSNLYGQVPILDKEENIKFLNSTHFFIPAHGEELKECKINGEILFPLNAQEALPNYRFTIIRELPNLKGYVISFLSWGEKDSRTLLLSKRDNVNLRYFWIPYTVYNTSCEILKKRSSFTFGIVNVPYKLRFGSGPDDTLDNGRQKRYFDFTSDLNLGLSAGWRFSPARSEKLTANLMGGVCVTGILLDSANTKGFAESSSRALAFTPYLSLVFDINHFQIGLYCGVDYIPGQIGRKWDYRDCPWFGIGMGYSILQLSGNRKQDKND